MSFKSLPARPAVYGSLDAVPHSRFQIHFRTHCRMTRPSVSDGNAV